MFLFRRLSNIDWILFLSTIPLLGAGLITMKGFSGVEIIGAQGGDYFFPRQLIWVCLSFAVFFAFSFIDWRFLKNGAILLLLLILSLIPLVLLLIFGVATRGSARWIHIFSFSVNPADIVKLLLILVLAKYFSRRHIEIARIKHVFISATYAIFPAILVFFQPDFGSAIVIFCIWFGMVAVSGISKKHLLLLFLILAIIFSLSWFFVLKPYQKNRIITFLNPLSDPRGAGYNALQSMIAVGSGKIFGKGVGYGTQSRLEFLPEHQTDFIFASFAEEWGFLGIFIIFIFFGILISRILKNAQCGKSNFEKLFGIGLAIFLISHIFINIGMNIGVLPITGIPLPLLSYGGSNLLTIFAGLGILMSMNKYGVNVPDDPYMV